MKTHLIIAATLLLAGSALADTYRVHYSIRGSGRDITVQAESSAEARRTVMDMFPGAVVTGVHRVRKAPPGHHGRHLPVSRSVQDTGRLAAKPMSRPPARKFSAKSSPRRAVLAI